MSNQVTGENANLNASQLQQIRVRFMKAREEQGIAHDGYEQTQEPVSDKDAKIEAALRKQRKA